MDKKIWGIIISSSVLIALNFLATPQIASQIPRILEFIDETGYPIHIIAFQSLLYLPVMLSAGYFYSRFAFPDIEAPERIITSFMISSLSYGWWVFLLSPVIGSADFFNTEHQLMAIWVVLMLLTGYAAFKTRGESI